MCIRDRSTGDLHLTVDNGTYGHTIDFSINGGGYNQSNDGVILTGGWHNVAITYSSGDIIFYYDGVEWGSVTNNATPINLDGFHLGNQYNDERWYSGIMDEVSIWNNALTAEQIQANMNTELSGSETGLVGYWNFNEGEGTTLTDLSGNGNDGTIIGATWSEDVYVPPVYGCTDPFAGNYDSDADTDDGSCTDYPDDGNYSLGFDGDDHVSVPYSNQLNSFADAVSISAWIKVTGGEGNYRTILENGNVEGFALMVSGGGDVYANVQNVVNCHD